MRNLTFFIFTIISISLFTACSQKPQQKDSSKNVINDSLISISKQENIDGRYLIRHKNINDKSPLGAYIIQVKGLGPQEYNKFAIELQYFGRNWIFFKNALIKGSNGEKFNFNITREDHTSSLDIAGDIKEYVSLELDKNNVKKLLTLLNSNIVNIELNGSKNKRYTLDKKSQNAIKDLINYYLKLS